MFDEKVYDTYMNEYLMHIKFIKRRSDSTVKEYKKILNSYKVYVIKIGFNKISFLSYLQDTSNLAPRTIRTRIIVIRSFLNYLTENSYITVPNFWKDASSKVPDETPKGLSEKQLEILFSVIENPYDLMFFSILLKLGLRISEGLGIKVENIIFQENYANLIIIGKGNKERILKITTELAQKMVSGKKMYVFEKIKADGTIEIPTQRTMQRKFKKYIILANEIIEKFKNNGENLNYISATPHALRHTCAKKLLNNGKNIEEVRYILGHSSIQTTGIYVRSEQQTSLLDEI